MPQPSATFPSELPPSLRCGFCGQLIDGIFFRTLKRFTCERCAAQARLTVDRHRFDPISFGRAVVAGLLVAAASAAAWAIVVHVTHWQIGIVASFIGVLVGQSIFAASGKRRGRSLQWLVAVLSVLGVLGGKFVYITWFLIDAAKENGDPVNASAVAAYLANLLREQPSQVLSVYDFVWAAIAVYAGWKICKPVKIVIAGPYQYESKTDGASAGAGGLQFDTVEPEQTETA